MNPYEELMQEPPGGHTSGDQATEFLQAGGWQVLSPWEGGSKRCGASAHRGVLQPDEHVDTESLRATVAGQLGFTTEEIETAFSSAGGRPSLERASLRAKIDARLLALSRSGGHMLALAFALGWKIEESRGDGGGRTCLMLKRALNRAKAAEVAAAA